MGGIIPPKYGELDDFKGRINPHRKLNSLISSCGSLSTRSMREASEGRKRGPTGIRQKYVPTTLVVSHPPSVTLNTQTSVENHSIAGLNQ